MITDENIIELFSRVQNKAYGNWTQNTEKTSTIFPTIS